MSFSKSVWRGLLNVSMNRTQQVFSLKQAVKVSFGFVELLRVVLQGNMKNINSQEDNFRKCFFFQEQHVWLQDLRINSLYL